MSPPHTPELFTVKLALGGVCITEEHQVSQSACAINHHKNLEHSGVCRHSGSFHPGSPVLLLLAESYALLASFSSFLPHKLTYGRLVMLSVFALLAAPFIAHEFSPAVEDLQWAAGKTEKSDGDQRAGGKSRLKL